MTNLTKRAMADALKQLLQKHSLDHITIQDVTDAAQVSRKTFYYHFHDIYDLVEWLLVEDCKILTQNHTDSGIWVRDVAIALNYATENRGWLVSIYQSMDRLQLEGILRKIVGPLMEASFEEALGDRPVQEEDRRFVLDIFTYGFTGLFLSWVGDGMRNDAAFLQDKLVRFFADSIKLMADRCVELADKKDEK